MKIPWYLMAKGKGTGGYKTASGSIVSISDAVAAPLRSLLVNIDPVQAGSGDPSPDNVRPISGWTGCNIFLSADVVFNKNTDEILQGSISSSTGVAQPSSTRVRTSFLTVKPNTTYTVLCNVPRCYTHEYSNGDTRVYIGNSEGWKTLPYTFTTKATTNELRIVLANTDDSGIILQDILYLAVLESGVSSYYPITWQSSAGTVYGGTLDVTNGVLTVDRAMVDLGTRSWAKQNESGFYVFYTSGIFQNAKLAPVICSQYKNASVNNHATLKENEVCWFNTTDRQITIRDTNYTDAAAFKTAMSGVQLVYELAAPITVPLTPTEISTLQGQNNVWADSGDVTVEYLASGGADPDLMKLAVAFMKEG